MEREDETIEDLINRIGQWIDNRRNRESERKKVIKRTGEPEIRRR